MVKHWENRKWLIDSLGLTGSWAHALWFLSIIFAIIGVISDLLDKELGITSMSWFLLALVFGILSIPFYIGVAISWYLKTTEK